MPRYCACLVSLFVFATAAVAADYYISAAGDNHAAGDRTHPWRTIARANSQDLQPGDRILFEGEQTFKGTLSLNRRERITIDSYGSGRAVIDGGTAGAITLDACKSVTVRNLKLIGAGRNTGNSASGLLIHRSANVTVNGVEVTGFRSSGIALDGVDAARITHVHAHENGFAGISSDGGRSRNLYVGYSLAENNPGDPTVRDNHSGNGIVIGRTDGALIEYCEARYNGWDMPWTGNGPVGIWTFESDRVTIQCNISHHNRSTAQDGGGFDLDGGVTNALVQYNYSHDNYGSGYLICQYAGAGRFADNTVRYNISQDDGLKDHDSGIFVWISGTGMKSTTVYNNTIFNTKGSAVAFGVDKSFTGPLPVFTFYNNIFVSRGPQIAGGAEKGRFVGNLYWAMGERGFRVDSYKSIEAWADATGQEKIDGRTVGRFADPLLRKDGDGMLTDPARLATLSEYQLVPGSPAVDTGIDLRRLFAIDPGARDYYGGRLPAGAAYDIGAHEYGGGGTP